MSPCDTQDGEAFQMSDIGMSIGIALMTSLASIQYDEEASGHIPLLGGAPTPGMSAHFRAVLEW